MLNILFSFFDYTNFFIFYQDQKWGWSLTTAQSFVALSAKVKRTWNFFSQMIDFIDADLRTACSWTLHTIQGSSSSLRREWEREREKEDDKESCRKKNPVVGCIIHFSELWQFFWVKMLLSVIKFLMSIWVILMIVFVVLYEQERRRRKWTF